MSTETIVAARQNSGLMNFIIGRAWLNTDTGRVGNLIINRDLPHDLVLHAGTTLLLTDQTDRKRAGKLDADYSVSILLPTEQAQRLIEETKAIAASRKVE